MKSSYKEELEVLRVSSDMRSDERSRQASGRLGVLGEK